MPTTFVHGRAGIFKLAPVSAGTTVTDISTWVDTITYPRTLDTAETTTFGQGARTYITGLPNNTWTLKGVYDGTAGAIDSILCGLVGAPVAVGMEFDPAGTTTGMPKWTMAGNTTGNSNPGVYVTDLTIDGAIADAVRFTVTLMGNLGVTRGVN
jgi:hypothetical protein